MHLPVFKVPSTGELFVIVSSALIVVGYATASLPIHDTLTRGLVLALMFIAGRASGGWG